MSSTEFCLQILYLLHIGITLQSICEIGPELLDLKFLLFVPASHQHREPGNVLARLRHNLIRAQLGNVSEKIRPLL